MLLEAIAALQAQDFADWELLIEDGGESVERLLPPDPRIRYFRVQDPNDARGDMVLRLAQGELLNYHADDDTLRPGALQHVHETIGDRQWLCGRVAYGTSGLTMGEPWDFERLKAQNYIPAPAVFWTREARDIVGGWDISLPWCHDWDYWLRLGERWEPAFTPQVLADYRVHPGQCTATMPGSAKAQQEAVIRERVRSGCYA
jgi:hypothetical protein